MARYQPKHRKRQRVAAQRAGIHAAACFVGGVVLLSGAYGNGPLGAEALTAPPQTESLAVVASGFPSLVASVSPGSPPSSVQPRKPESLAQRQAGPAFIDIPAIGAQSTIIDLGTMTDGELETPNDFNKVGWWTGGVRPGETGPAVMAGHVDSFQGPAIFARLNELKPDDIVRVARRDGQVLTFAVTRVDRHPKDLFPTELVYGPTADAELRLVTCGGVFDKKAHSYKDNTVVYARLVNPVEGDVFL